MRILVDCVAVVKLVDELVEHRLVQSKAVVGTLAVIEQIETVLFGIFTNAQRLGENATDEQQNEKSQQRSVGSNNKNGQQLDAKRFPRSAIKNAGSCCLRTSKRILQINKEEEEEKKSKVRYINF